MRKIIGTIGLALTVAACSGGGTEKVVSAPVQTPQLAQCPKLVPLGKPALARSSAIALPTAPFASMLASNSSQLAFLRPGGATGCTDVRLLSNVSNLAALQGDRFISFAWSGFEENGYRADGNRLIDRVSGAATETGGAPVFSPSGQLFAAAYQSESAFSALEGFAVWKVMPSGPMQVAVVSELPEMLNWRVDGWGGESCVNLSAVPFAMVPIGTRDFTGVAREKYVARQVGAGWQVNPAQGKGCPA